MTTPAAAQVIRELETEWRALSLSRPIRRQLASWAAQDPRLDHPDADALVAAARHRSPGEVTCETLDALLVRAGAEPLALRIAIQVMLPRWCALIASLGGAPDEVAMLVVAVGTEQLLRTDPRDGTTTPTDWRLWCNTRRQVLRALQRDRDHARNLVDPPDIPAPDGGELSEAFEVDELLRWVAASARVDLSDAQLVVLTRVGGVPLVEVARSRGTSPATLRQHRSRTERKLRSRLAAVEIQ